MSDTILSYIGAICIAVLIFTAAWLAHRLIEAALPPSAEELAARQAKKLAKQAAKEFKRRQRLRVGWLKKFRNKYPFAG